MRVRERDREKRKRMGSLGGGEVVVARKMAMWLQPKIIGAIPSERWGHSACYHNGLVYVFGGCCGGMHFSDVLVLNLEKMAWNILVTRGQGPGPRDSHSAVLVGHKMIVFGGTNGSEKVNDVHVLDLQSKEWTIPECTGTPPSPRESHTATLVGDEKLVIFGGSGEGEANYLNDLYVLDLKTMRWTSPEVRGSIPVPRDSHSAVAIGNRLFLYGGDSGDRYQGGIDVLDMETLTWSRLDVQGPSPSARAGHASVNFGTKIYVIGGVGDKQYFNDIWVLDVATCSWTQLDICGQKPQGRFSHTAIITNLSIAIYGGCGEDERPLNELLILQLGLERVNGLYNVPVYRTSGSQCHQECKRPFLRGENNMQKGMFWGSKEDDELESPSKQSFCLIGSDSFHPKRRRTNNNSKTFGVESEAEEHSLSLSQHSSPSQSDQEQTPVKKASDCVRAPTSLSTPPLLQQQNVTCCSLQNPRIASRPTPASCLDILGEHSNQPQHVHTVNTRRHDTHFVAEESKCLEPVQFHSLVGAEVHGKVDGAFDSGYLMTAVVNGRTFRGILFPPGPSHVGRGPKHSQRPYVQHQVIMNPRTNHSQMPTRLQTSEVRPVNLRRSSPVVRSSTSLDTDVKHRNELQGVVLTLGGPGNGTGSSLID